MGAPAVPLGSPSSFERWVRWPAPSTNALQWWRARGCCSRAPAMTALASASVSTRSMRVRNREREISSSATAGAAMV